MKKLITRTFIIIILIFTIYGFKDKVYGKVCDEEWTLFRLVYAKTDGLTAESNKVIGGKSILETLNECVPQESKIEFSAKTLTNPLIIKSKITVTGPSGSEQGYFNVKLGEMLLGVTQEGIEKNVGLEAFQGGIFWQVIIDKLGFNGDISDLQMSMIEPISWDVVVEVELPEKGTADVANPAYSTESYKLYSAKVLKVYTDEDMKTPSPGEKVEIFDEPEEETGLIETAVGWNQTLNSWITNPIENIVSLLLDLVKLIFGDVPQIFANFIQTGFESNGISNLKISFKPSELKGRNQDSPTNPNAYIKFEEGTSTDKHFEGQEVITIPSKPKTIKKSEEEEKEEENEDQTYGFSEDSKIPLISVDLFTLAGNKVQMVDVNFLDIRNNQNDSWLYIRNFIASIVHAAMYITIGILILVLIWNAILIVKDSINGANAESARRHKEVLEKLAKAVVMLVGTLILEALLIYGSQMFLGEIGKIGGDTYEGPIRVVVQDDIYTFSTTPTGYIRYMADISNIKLNTTKAMYVGIYILLAWSNLLFLIIMMIRMILMMLLAVVGFIIVIMYIIENNGTAMHKYKSWISIYASLAVIQIVMGILFKIIMEVAVK